MKTTKLLLSLFGAALTAVSAWAIPVTLNTSALTAGGTYYVDFQLTDGSGVGNGNNSALIDGFNFGGGAATGDIGTLGGATGSLNSTVALTDTSFFNEFFQSFTAGSFLSFNLNLSNNFNGSTPDGFGFAILDENLFNLGTYSPGTDQFLSVDINGGAVNYQTYAGIDGTPAPRVPEAGSTLLFASVGLLGLAGFRRWLTAARLAA